MLVSLCIVAYNEELYIKDLLADVGSQTYPHDMMEIILIDSISTDKTKQYMTDFADAQQDFADIRILDNPKKKQAAGWNAALKNYKGDIIIRIDAHSRIPADFVAKNVELIRNGEYICGGKRPNVIQNSSPWGTTLLLAEQSMFGSSFADFRNSNERKYVKSVFHGAYRREVFEKAGYFNENLGRTEDNEIHYRIRKAGYRICYSPEIISYQYARSSLKSMLRQKYGNGYWVMLTLKVCPGCISIYHFVPFVFVLGIIVTTLLAMCGFPQLSILMWGLYGILAVTMSVLAILHNKRCVEELLLPFIFLALHISYGLGSLAALFKLPFWKEK